MPANIEYIETRRMSPETWAAMEDSQLMAAVAQGDKGAFTALVSRHLNQVVHYALRYVSRHTDAEDVAQEAFIRLWKHAGSWKEKGYSLRSWIYKITYNLCIDELRKRKQTVAIDDEPFLASGDAPEETVLQSQQHRQIDEALNELPERQRTAIVLCAFQGMSNIEAAQVMEVSVEALESLLSRGRRSLRKKMAAPD